MSKPMIVVLLVACALLAVWAGVQFMIADLYWIFGVKHSHPQVHTDTNFLEYGHDSLAFLTHIFSLYISVRVGNRLIKMLEALPPESTIISK